MHHIKRDVEAIRNITIPEKYTKQEKYSIPVMHEVSWQIGVSRSHLDESTHLH